jgi:hypothetical protein
MTSPGGGSAISSRRAARPRAITYWRATTDLASSRLKRSRAPQTYASCRCRTPGPHRR